MKMKTYIAGPIDANNYLVWDEQSHDAVLIDCSDYREDVLADIKTNNLNVKYILLTHGHFDHVLGVNKMREALGAKVVLHKEDRVLTDNINEYGNIFIGLPKQEIPKIDIEVEDNDILAFGGKKIKVIHTPGHTEGGVCYLIDDKLFCGDTMFRGSYGRTDLFGGNYTKIKDSIKNILFKLDDNILIYPGHGDFSDMGYEKKYNDINL